MRMRRRKNFLELLTPIAALLNDILTITLLDLSKTENVESVDKIPGVKDIYAHTWLIRTEISVFECCRPVVFYFGFMKSVPFTLPDVYCLDFNFGEIPHIGEDHKLCIFEDATTYDINNYSDVVKAVLQKAKKLIKKNLEGTNYEDFKNEISSYWQHVYKNEKVEGILDNYLITDIPEHTQVLHMFNLYESLHLKIVLSSAESYDETIGKRLFLYLLLVRPYILNKSLCQTIRHIA